MSKQCSFISDNTPESEPNTLSIAQRDDFDIMEADASGKARAQRLDGGFLSGPAPSGVGKAAGWFGRQGGTFIFRKDAGKEALLVLFEQCFDAWQGGEVEASSEYHVHPLSVEDVPEHFAGRYVEENSKEAAKRCHGQGVGQPYPEGSKEDAGTGNAQGGGQAHVAQRPFR